MQNEFEKQVQQKMEELNFVPSQPVWQNIEKQIRKEKDRRRIIFWLPLGLAFLIGAGIYSWYAGNNATTRKAMTSQDSKQVNEKAKPLNNNAGKPVPAIRISEYQKNDKNVEAINRQTLAGRTNAEGPNQFKVPGIVSAGETTESTLNLNTLPAEIKKGDNMKLLQKVPFNTAMKDVEMDGGINKVEHTAVTGAQKKITENHEMAKPGIVEKTTIPAGTLKTDSIKKKDTLVKNVVHTGNMQESNTVSAPVKNVAEKNKWKLGITMGMGFSGEGNGISLGDNKRFDQLSSGGVQTPPQNIPGAASPINKNFSFGTGIVARKEMSKVLSFLTGLQFQYYSSSRKVGKEIPDSTFQTGEFASEVYLNSGADANKVSSSYFFISLPLMVDWQIIKDRPFHLQTGFSVQQLLGSNAIQFDQEKNIYYSDKTSLHKTRLFANLALGYEFQLKNKNKLLLGPALQYALGRVSEKENKHLFYTGINAQYYFR